MRVLSIALFTLLFTMTAAAIPLPITIYDTHGAPPAYAYGSSTPGNAYNGSASYDVLGYLRDFDVEYVKFTTIEVGKIEAEIHVNYASGQHDPLDPDPTAWGTYVVNGNRLRTGDLLFDVDGVYKYGVALTEHDALTAGALYRIANHPTESFELNSDSDRVLGPSSGIRSGIPVWINSHSADLVPASGISLSSHRGAGAADWFINLSFVPTVQFLEDLASPGLSVHYASATCANDFLHGNILYSPVPEPMSMVLMGGGLLALGLFGRRFRRG